MHLKQPYATNLEGCDSNRLLSCSSLPTMLWNNEENQIFNHELQRLLGDGGPVNGKTLPKTQKNAL